MSNRDLSPFVASKAIVSDEVPTDPVASTSTLPSSSPKRNDTAELQEKYRRLKRKYFELEEKHKETTSELERSSERNLHIRHERNVLLERIMELEGQSSLEANSAVDEHNVLDTESSLSAFPNSISYVQPHTTTLNNPHEAVVEDGHRSANVGFVGDLLSGTHTHITHSDPLETQSNSRSLSISPDGVKPINDLDIPVSPLSPEKKLAPENSDTDISAAFNGTAEISEPIPSGQTLGEISVPNLNPVSTEASCAESAPANPSILASKSSHSITNVAATNTIPAGPLSMNPYAMYVSNPATTGAPQYPHPYPNPYFYIPGAMPAPLFGAPYPLPGPAPKPSSSIEPPRKPKRIKSQSVTSKNFSIPLVPRDKNGNPMLPLNVGIMTVLSLGEVCMREHFHTERYIFPVGYEVTRRYLSTIDPSLEVVYHCTILDGGDGPKFQIIPSDSPDRHIIAGTATGAWSSIVKQANAIRNRQHSNSVSGPDFFGLGQNTIKHLIQELPNADKLRDYVWQNYVEGGPLGGRHAAVIPALPEEYESAMPIGAWDSRLKSTISDSPRTSHYPPHLTRQPSDIAQPTPQLDSRMTHNTQSQSHSVLNHMMMSSVSHDGMQHYPSHTFSTLPGGPGDPFDMSDTSHQSNGFTTIMQSYGGQQPPL